MKAKLKFKSKAVNNDVLKFNDLARTGSTKIMAAAYHAQVLKYETDSLVKLTASLSEDKLFWQAREETGRVTEPAAVKKAKAEFTRTVKAAVQSAKLVLRDLGE